jgi:hypothetical protein
MPTMGLTIDFRIRLKSTSQAIPFVAAAVAEARRRGWRVRRRKSTDPRAIVAPHPKCEDIDIDFADGTLAEGIVKTSFATIETHVSIVEFFDALKPLCRSIKLDDETGYAKHRDVRKLRATRESFESAFQSWNPADPGPVFFTGLVVRSDGSAAITPEAERRLSKSDLAKMQKTIRALNERSR